MAFSFTRLIIPDSDILTYQKAYSFVEKNHIQVKRQGTASCIGKIDEYNIWLGFKKGVPVWQCSCEINIYGKIQKLCFHALAVSLLWDRDRGVPDPSQEDVEYLVNTGY